MEIKKGYKDTMPKVKLIGKQFTNNDRDESGTFARYWQQSFQEGWFDTLKQSEGIPNVSDDPLGMMRMTGKADDDFEYWIGIFRALDADVPEGFSAVEIPAGEVGVCWLYGNDKNGELYGMEASNLSMNAIKDQGWNFDDTGWFFERYNSPRFTHPDKEGNVILDICAYLV